MKQLPAYRMIKHFETIKKSVKGMNPVLTLVGCLSLSSAFAQSNQPHTPMTDTLELPPGTIHARVLIKDIQNLKATVEIIEVMAEGHGIVNVLSKGQVLTIAIREKGKMSKGKKTEVFLKEKVGMDASQSSYTLLRTKDL